ncbi:MAG: hypothetical protein A2086_12620 [Spirochaetes bacterium GWD1_27_9]|nr:MAG: hypothetical protein A2Z98_10830 [Spirochaetes bacterium GWB1_27_13]OHD27445.1 MAG: hypothetical protein A2Y34_16285 [Spirochaetes bacterium GWC1_27_15]OHD44302.1 MAG: hypothetical protein A2086_12620 [Spirochaetes bacterium GWD1_27_9]
MSELIQKATQMINDFVTEKGIKAKDVYDADKQIWRLQRGSAAIQILLLSVPVGENQIREFLQVASPLMKIPAGNELAFYRRLLELNDLKLGVKLSIQRDSEQVWALYERDLIGMNYTELKTCLEDLGYWADDLDDLLIEEFGGSK